MAATTYITTMGDTWDWIAKQVYGDELKADVLMQANGSLLYTARFDSGVEITCPALESTAGTSLPEWRQ
jgi:phage tail protein X